MTSKLVVSDGTAEREMPLVGRIIVGRDPACDISHDHALLSRRHAEFVAAGERVVVRDLGSRNGVFVNGVRTAEHSLRSGDIVQIGPLRAQYLADAAACSILAGDHDCERAAAGEIRRPLVPTTRPMIPPPQIARVAGADDDDDVTRLMTVDAGRAKASLRIVGADGSGSVVALRGRKVLIGRGLDNDVVLADDDKGVSRTHAELRWEKGSYVIVDLQSQNGTWINGRRVARAEVPVGTTVVIGDYQLTLQKDSGGLPIPGPDRVVRKPGESIESWRMRSDALDTRYAYSKAALARRDYAAAAGGFQAILHEEPGFLDSAQLLVQANAGADGARAFADAKQLDDRGQHAAAVKEYEKAVQWLPAEDPDRLAARARLEELTRTR